MVRRCPGLRIGPSPFAYECHVPRAFDSPPAERILYGGTGTNRRRFLPVTAKFSEEFYERLGHGVADELVDWFNTVDATYRSDLRDLFQGQFTALRHEIAQRLAAFDAKLEQRISEVRGELRGVGGELREEIAGLETRLRVDMHSMQTRLVRWMVAMWAGTIGTMIALLRLWG